MHDERIVHEDLTYFEVVGDKGVIEVSSLGGVRLVPYPAALYCDLGSGNHRRSLERAREFARREGLRLRGSGRVMGLRMRRHTPEEAERIRDEAGY